MTSLWPNDYIIFTFYYILSIRTSNLTTFVKKVFKLDALFGLWQNDCFVTKWLQEGGGYGMVTPFFFLIFVLVGLKEACMSNFSFLGSFSGTSPGRADAGYFKIKAKSAQLSWILGWAWQKSMIIVVPSSERLTAWSSTLGPKRREKVNDYSGTIVW